MTQLVGVPLWALLFIVAMQAIGLGTLYFGLTIQRGIFDRYIKAARPTAEGTEEK